MLITKNMVKKILPRRSPTDHKGTAGHLLNIAGSESKPGAAILSSLGAFRIGVGLVTLATDKVARSAIASRQPEIMTEIFPVTIQQWKKLLLGKKCIAFGPGIEPSRKMAKILRWISTAKVPIVIDATGLTLLSANKGILKQLKTSAVLTPHPGEMSRLTGISTKNIQVNRSKVAKEFAKKHKVILILKGSGTLVASPDGRLWKNPTGNVVLATAGTGDLLTGMIAGLISQGVTPLNAAIAAVYIHGLAGDKLRKTRGDRGIVATDLLKELPLVLRELTGK